MDRVFLSPDVLSGEVVVVSGPDRHHLADVLRVRKGQRFLATDGMGREVLLEAERVDKAELHARVLEDSVRAPGPGRDVTLAIAPPKGGRMDLAVEKTVECGVGRIVPMLATRSVVKSAEESSRHGRWRRVAQSALAQSGRCHLPELCAPLEFTQALQEAAERGRILIAHPGVTASSVSAAVEADPENPLTLFVGPEGGFTEEELEEARGAGATQVSLGPTSLRSETAAIVAVTLAMASLAIARGMPR